MPVALIESITMSLHCLFLIVCLYHMYKTLSERFICVYFSKFSPVALIGSIAMSLSIPNTVLDPIYYAEAFSWGLLYWHSLGGTKFSYKKKRCE